MMDDVAGVLRGRTAAVIKQLGMVTALIITLTLVGVNPAAAGQATPTQTMTQRLPEASEHATAQACKSQRPGSGWWLEGGYPNPHGCSKCLIAAVGWELTGNYRTWCSQEANGAILWLFCVVCRGADGEEATRELDWAAPA